MPDLVIYIALNKVVVNSQEFLDQFDPDKDKEATEMPVPAMGSQDPKYHYLLVFSY